jgi:hypothetical protein
MTKDFNNMTPRYFQPDFDVYYLDVDEQSKQPIKLFLYVTKEDMGTKIPLYYKYLYSVKHEVYVLAESVVYRTGDTRNPCPPKKTYAQHGNVFIIKTDIVTIRDTKPFKYVRN